jgi:hypothetical protein
MRTVTWKDARLLFGEVTRDGHIAIFRQLAELQAAGADETALKILVDDLLALHSLRAVYADVDRETPRQIIEAEDVAGARLPFTTVEEFRALPASLASMAVEAAVAENPFLVSALFHPSSDATTTVRSSDSA